MQPTLRLARKLRMLFVAQIGASTAYRAEIIIWMLSGTLSLIMGAIWVNIAEANGGRVGTYTSADLVAYFTGTWVTSQLLVVWVAWELDYQIRLGHLSPKLLRPLDPVWEHLTNHVTERFIRLPLIALLAGVVLLLVPGASFTTDPLMYAAYAGLIALAFLIRFLLEYCVGLLCFWTESATAFSELTWLVYAGLGGTFAPLALYPEAVQRVVLYTPFPYMIYFPARLLSGRADWPEVGTAALVLLGWLAVLLIARQLLWRVGLRRYGAVGA